MNSLISQCFNGDPGTGQAPSHLPPQPWNKERCGETATGAEPEMWRRSYRAGIPQFGWEATDEEQQSLSSSCSDREGTGIYSYPDIKLSH